MTRKIYKKLPPVNSEEGEGKCVQHSGPAAVTLYLHREAGVALEPGVTEIIKHTQQFQAHAICTKGSSGVRSDPQPGFGDTHGSGYS